MPALGAIYAATARQFRRDGMALLFTLLLPVLMAAFFGLVFAEDPAGQDGLRPAERYVPGMLSLGLLWLGVFGTAPPLVQLRVLKVFRRIGATPLPPAVFLAGQIAFRVTTGTLQAALLLAYGTLVHGIRLHGNGLVLIPVVLLGAALFVALGCLLAAFARSGEAVIALGQVVQFPMMFLSGTLFPLDMLPGFLRPAASAMPLTYLNDALTQVMLGAPGLRPLWLDCAVMGGLLVALSLLAARLFRWE